MARLPVSQLAARMQMDGVIRFRDRGECVYEASEEVLKLYRPRSVRRTGGRSSERALMGELGFVLRTELPALDGAQRLLAPPSSLTLCPIMNFPKIVRYSAVDDDGVSLEFVEEVRKHLHVLPGTLAGIRNAFGASFLQEPELGRLPVVANFIRGHQKE